MKLQLLAVAIVGGLACSSPELPGSSETGMTTQTIQASRPRFLPLATMNLSWGDGGPVQVVRLPIPVRGPAGLRIAALHISLPMRWPNTPDAEWSKREHAISVPTSIVYWNPLTGERAGKTPELGYFNERAAEYFGLPTPADRLVGRFDDPSALPRERAELLRKRICSALDVLLPFFAEENMPWTEQATRAAQEVRDFFPLAAEPGLWPYYKAEGREFFAWVERHASPEKAPLPWETARP